MVRPPDPDANVAARQPDGQPLPTTTLSPEVAKAIADAAAANPADSGGCGDAVDDAV
jgi:hypothetical protein